MIDLILLGLIVLSALFGLMRGLLSTLLGMFSWVVSGWVAYQFGDQVALLFSSGSAPGAGDYGLGYGVAFFGTRVVIALAGMMLRGLVDSTALLRMPDRLFGLGLGIARGVLLAVVVVLLLGFTSMVEKPAWRESMVVPWLQPMAGWLRGQLPEIPELPDMPELPKMTDGSLMDLGKSVLAGDNGGPNDKDVGSGQPPAGQKRVALPLELPAGLGGPQPPARALPSNIDPAQVRPDQADPKRAGDQGQARPPSR